jgi:hypothetical protein
MELTILVEAYADSEYDEQPCGAIISIDDKDLEFIKSSFKFIKESGAIKTCSYGSMWVYNNGFPPESEYDVNHNLDTEGFDIIDGDDYERTDTEMLCVYEGRISFHGYYKHGGTSIDTNSISLDEEGIDLLIGMTLEDAPKYLEHENPLFRAKSKKMLTMSNKKPEEAAKTTTQPAPLPSGGLYMGFETKEDGSVEAVLVDKDLVEKGRFTLDLYDMKEIEKAESLGIDMRYAAYAYEFKKAEAKGA